MLRLLNWFRPAPPIPRLSESEIERRYPRERWRVFEAAFFAYALFYIVRNNLAPVSKEMGLALGYDKSMIGDILAGTAMAYGIGKFVMGYFADRCDARKYIAFGMLLTAAINFVFGATTNYWGHLFLWTLNGFVQGMGYGPCARGLSHWFSPRERGTFFGIWNISHNLGGGMAGFLAAWCAERWGWPSAFYVPGIIAMFGLIGFLVYVPVMFSGVVSLDLTSKKAVGTAAGFVGFFGYIGRVIQGKGLGWIAQHHGWNAALLAVVICTMIGAVLLATLWNVRPRG